MKSSHKILVCFAVVLSTSVCFADAGTQLKVFPPEISLRGQGDRLTIAVQLVNDQGITRDVSSTVVVKVADAKIVEVTGQTLKPKADGETKLLIELGQNKVEVPVVVKDSQVSRVVGVVAPLPKLIQFESEDRKSVV